WDDPSAIGHRRSVVTGGSRRPMADDRSQGSCGLACDATGGLEVSPMPDPAAGDVFADLLDANRRYRDFVHTSALEGRALKGLAVVTCMDSRIDPLAMLGLERGDAKVIRNAGGRVTGDALRSLILATNLLGVNRICVIQHTGCAMAGS